ncbi:hypothetical protein A374_02844 [Fictibacillus macauensis ZFHKF-1]|uniref:Calcineurin-like phosphoesterase domain-containing protein n=1 Tax=Fictibacillus macauensis ZFHKF-1 TaxID=1196324 RepID=I8J5S5_9BACL|nr:metallophosphoesterase [Fictibacillus macauensis]EIT87156.1 hypothetical protein A374_02844 [Fictibacillus macauensis ZFHKF-1]
MNSSWRKGGIATGALAGVAGAALVYATCIEPHWYDIKKVTVPLPILPKAFHSFTIVHISDLHIGYQVKARHVKKIVAAISAQKPDLIVFTGDFINSARSIKAARKCIPYFQELSAPYGKFAVWGNHDYLAPDDERISLLQEAQFTCLVNEHTHIDRGEDTLYLAGLDDYLEGTADIEKALDGIPDESCTILLAHEPDYFKVSMKYNISLQLSGHSHGGQVCVPFYGPLVTSKLGKAFHSGLYQHPSEPKFLYTNRGLGTTHLPVRFACRPEITVLTLVQGS